MSDQKLSEEMLVTLPDITWSVSRVRKTVEMWSYKAAALEAKLEAMEWRLVEARALIEDVGGSDDWEDRAEQWLFGAQQEKEE